MFFVLLSMSAECSFYSFRWLLRSISGKLGNYGQVTLSIWLIIRINAV